MLLRRGEHVEDPAAHRELASVLHQVHAGVRRSGEPAYGVLEGDVLPRGEADRLEVAEPGHQWLQEAAYGGHDDSQGSVAVGVVGVGQPAKDRQPAADRVGPWRQALVRQRLPGREVGDRVGREQAAQRIDQVLALAARRRHGEDRPTGTHRWLGGEDRDEQRPQRPWRGQLQQRSVARPGRTDRLGDRRVGGQRGEQASQVHGSAQGPSGGVSRQHDSPGSTTGPG